MITIECTHTESEMVMIEGAPDYTDGCGWDYYFEAMLRVYSNMNRAMYNDRLLMRDGILGVLIIMGSYPPRWYALPWNVQESYSKWLDKQIYGESNG